MPNLNIVGRLLIVKTMGLGFWCYCGDAGI
jgi:hypothetical protein